MGVLPCDDGNTIDGDGCSATCTIEFGYKCVQQRNRSDICYDIIHPFIQRAVIKGKNTIGISFSEPIRFLELNSKIKDKHFV